MVDGLRHYHPFNFSAYSTGFEGTHGTVLNLLSIGNQDCEMMEILTSAQKLISDFCQVTLSFQVLLCRLIDIFNRIELILPLL